MLNRDTVFFILFLEILIYFYSIFVRSPYNELHERNLCEPRMFGALVRDNHFHPVRKKGGDPAIAHPVRI